MSRCRGSRFWKFRLVLSWCLGAAVWGFGQGIVVRGEGDFSEGGRAHYEEHVKPLLKARCYACHGALKQKAGLRLDTGEMIRKGGDAGAVVRVGDPVASQLLQRVVSMDAGERMPPEGEPLEEEEIEALRHWIEAGAGSPVDEAPEPDPDQHWAFLTPQRPPVPQVSEMGHNVIDSFIHAAHERQGLVAQREASPSLWLRRVFLDLTGVPPTPEEQGAFLGNPALNAPARAVDRLLASPRHGERWARHWMDVWRYSDWYGRRSVPDVWNSAPQIWRWRDWMVRSLNADKGYDQMIREMLAADEVSPGDAEAAVATGYLVRNWYALNPNDWMRNIVEHTGKAFLGLTFNCAHCHDHKSDPIAHEDYFRFRAFFEPLYVRQDRVVGEENPGPFQDYEYGKRREVERRGAIRVFDKALEAPTWFYTGGDERNRVEARGSIAPGVPKVLTHFGAPRIEPVALPLEAWYPGMRSEIQATARQERWEALQRALAWEKQAEAKGEAAWAAARAKVVLAESALESVEARMAAERAHYGKSSPEEVSALAGLAAKSERRETLARLRFEVAEAQREQAEEEAVESTEADEASFKQRQAAVAAASQAVDAARKRLEEQEAALAEVSTDEYTPLSEQFPRTSSGRRKALAEWMTDRRHPLTARVAVNHVWMRHFHEPLVASVTDWGRSGSRPTHPALLDWLATEWVASDWSMKRLHRLVVLSRAYGRDSSQRGLPEATPSLDPENRWLWRMHVGRMESEVLRDSGMHVAGVLDWRMGGQELENPESMTSPRRSLYFSVHPEAGGKSAMGALFDAPDPLDCYRRTRSVVPQQALALTNSEWVHRLSEAVARSDALEGGDAETVTAVVDRLFVRILGRLPTAQERALCETRLVEAGWKEGGDSGSDEDRRQARARLARVLFNHNDFISIR